MIVPGDTGTLVQKIGNKCQFPTVLNETLLSHNQPKEKSKIRN